MKRMLTKTMRSVMALLLVGCMLFGLCGAALAAENGSGTAEVSFQIRQYAFPSRGKRGKRRSRNPA